MIIKRTPVIALKIACVYAGGQRNLARELGVNQATICQWVKKGKANPEYIQRISDITGGDVTIKDLRPDIF